MTKRIISIAGFVCLAMFFAGCPKKSNQLPPLDEETQSAVQASYMNYLVSDMEMLMSFVAEGQADNNQHFYSQVSPESGTITAISMPGADGLSGQIRVSYDHTYCRDGITRHGSIYLDYTVTSAYPNARYMRSYQFSGKFGFSDYQVGDYAIQLNSLENGSFTIANTLPTATYSPRNTNLTWKIDGKLAFSHLSDARKNMNWEGHWEKTLANTSNSLVVASPTSAINWYHAIVQYVGSSSGTLPVTNAEGNIETKTFNMSFRADAPLTRDFSCSPDPVLNVNGVSNAAMIPVASEHHPFVGGIASFTIGNAYPRQIYYGNEGQRTLLPTPQCDNSGEVLIKGQSFKVDFLR